MSKYWESTSSIEVNREKEYTNLAKEYQLLLTKVESISKLIEEILNILLSYNPKLAEQTKEQLEKINEQNNDKSPEPRSDTT